jgi:hypothetical protein
MQPVLVPDYSLLTIFIMYANPTQFQNKLFFRKLVPERMVFLQIFHVCTKLLLETNLHCIDMLCVAAQS